jgi:TetR/AcrR family transcriptional regulator, regulator of autoinduction and epiphytic fitness
MIALLEEGDESPTARRIAARAGVSLRLVFHHFDDVEALLRTAVAVQAERHWLNVRPIPSELDLSSRVRALVRQRVELYETIGPVRRTAAAIERSSPTVAAELSRSRLLLRRQLEETFAPELERITPSSRRKVLDALDTATSLEVWDGLGRMERSPAHIRQVLELLVEAALERSRA